MAKARIGDLGTEKEGLGEEEDEGVGDEVGETDDELVGLELFHMESREGNINESGVRH